MKNKDIFLQIVDALVNDGYIIINDALCSDLAKELKITAQNSSGFKQAGISSNKITDKSRRKDKIKWLDEDNASQSQYLTFIKELQEHLNKELFLGLKYYESHFSLYEKGDFYEKHFDAFQGSKNRVVTTVYYLNKDWNEKDGGELIIYNEDNNLLTKVIPKANTLVVFLSEKFPHEVLPAKKKRFSIAGWFRIDQYIPIPLTFTSF